VAARACHWRATPLPRLAALLELDMPLSDAELLLEPDAASECSERERTTGGSAARAAAVAAAPRERVLMGSPEESR
jgi:hypothetical protein